MDPEERKLLEKVLQMSEENNRMIHRLYRSWWWGRIGKTFYWLLVVGIAFGAFYFLQPYIDRIRDTLNGVQQEMSKVQKVSQSILGD